MISGEDFSLLEFSENVDNFPEEQVSEYLSNHPDYLETFVLNEVDIEKMERWIIRKSQQLKKRPEFGCRNTRKTSLSRFVRQNPLKFLYHRWISDGNFACMLTNVKCSKIWPKTSNWNQQKTKCYGNYPTVYRQL